MKNQFWEAPTFDKNILIVPNYTHFGNDKDINSDSFVLVMDKFLTYRMDLKDINFIIPHPTGYIPTSLSKHKNVELIPMGELSTFPPLMRVQYPHKFFKKILVERGIHLIWSHLPEWTNQLLISRRFSTFQKIIGYSHWWEIKDNGGYQYNSFIDNINGILQMEVCGVNSQWVKNKVLERASEYFNNDIIKKLDNIIQPWYLGSDDWVKSTKKNDVPTFLFNHRINEYTGGEYFFKLMDKMWDKGYKFKVYTTNSSIDKPYSENVRAVDRETYLSNISSAHFGIGTFKKYSAWSLSVIDGLSADVPYLLPKGLCYDEMVGDTYPYLYDDRKQFEEWIESILKGEFENKHDPYMLETICTQLDWSKVVEDWDVKKYLK
tara:strand:- start:483 stop:1613 length:1131 start_codon:yes stop_codon:yes gene_type:complete